MLRFASRRLLASATHGIHVVSQRLRILGIGAAFFLSGAAALVYQVAWQRLLELQTGVGVYSVAAIVAGFMIGLGIGSHAASVLSPRCTPAGALNVFAAIELGIAFFGLLSCSLYYDWLYVRWGWLFSSPWRAVGVQFVALFLPTFLMGMSLPFLTRAMVTSVTGAGRTVGLLYAVNTLGAALGALAAPWVLIRLTGIRGAVYAAALANLTAGVGALWVGIKAAAACDAPSPTTEPSAPETTRRSLALWMGLYCLSGFCALGLEIVWFRLVDVAVRSNAFTFGTILGLYLSGTGLGCLIGILQLHRFREPMKAFLIAQCVLLLLTGLAILLMVKLPPQTPFYREYVFGWTRSVVLKLGRKWDLSGLVRWYCVLPALVFGLPTILMGLSFPLLQRAVHDDVRTSGRKVGLLQAANIAGCAAGSLAVGLVFLNLFGTSGTIRLIVALGLVFAATGVVRFGLRSVFVPAGAALIAMVLAIPGQDALWCRLHGTRPDGVSLIAEDATGVAAVTPRRPEGWFIWVNGKAMSYYPYGGFHSALGAVPAVVHPAPREVSIIGLGSGDTASALLAASDVPQMVDIFEICGPNRALLDRLTERDGGPQEMLALLRDTRVRQHVADGRSFLTHTERRFDIIEIDALWPSLAYAGNLYSTEFFALCASRLRPGGLMCSWSPTPRVRASFCRAFAHVVELRQGAILLGSNEPIPIERGRWRATLRSDRVRARLGLRRAQNVLAMLRTAQALPPHPQQVPEAFLNRDLFPRDELDTPGPAGAALGAFLNPSAPR